ncbi:MAG: hypothetical protein KIH62_000925 [Candidatus Kerfeldbacteria bacterium]|nr:hypothetical protein [Candidatus Kerfeldbacteria bacterium]
MRIFFNRAWTLFTQQFATFFILAFVSQLVLTAFARLVQFLDGQSIVAIFDLIRTEPSTTLSVIQQHPWYVALFLLSILMDMLVAIIVTYVCIHQPQSMRTTSTGVLRILPKALLVSIMTGAIIGTGMILFIVPGIIAAVFFAFASPYIIVRSNPSIANSLSESMLLGKKYFFNIASILILLNVGVYILNVLWGSITESVAQYVGADVVVALVSQLIVIYSTIVFTYFGLSLLEKQES